GGFRATAPVRRPCRRIPRKRRAPPLAPAQLEGARFPPVCPAVTQPRRILMVVNRDAFFLSHRLPLARGARDAGFEVVVVTGESGSGPAIRAEGFEFVPLPITRSAINPFADMRTVIALAKLYRRYRPVLVHHST